MSPKKFDRPIDQDQIKRLEESQPVWRESIEMRAGSGLSGLLNIIKYHMHSAL